APCRWFSYPDRWVALVKVAMARLGCLAVRLQAAHHHNGVSRGMVCLALLTAAYCWGCAQLIRATADRAAQSYVGGCAGGRPVRANQLGLVSVPMLGHPANALPPLRCATFFLVVFG